MKKNLILSIVSLCISSLLIVFISYAWFLSNAQVTAGILNVNVSGVDCEVTIETYQSSQWRELDELSFDNIEPGDTFYFRLKVVVGQNVRLNAKADDYTSNVISGSDGISVDLEKSEITYQGVTLFNIEDNNTVIIDDAVVYNVSNSGAINVVDNYKIEKAFNVYNLGTSVTGAPSIAGATAVSLEDNIFGSGVTLQEGTSYAYFALEYEDYDSSSDATKEYASNNYFVYQVLHIDSINVFVN